MSFSANNTNPKPVTGTPILQKQTLVDGVFEGGGALGTAYVGALRALHDNNIWFRRVAGNSAGAITAALIAAGFSAPEMQWLSSGYRGAPAVPDSLKNFEQIDFTRFLDLPTIDTVSNRSKRKTLLWQALNGTVIDEIGKIPIPIPTQKEAVDRAVGKIFGIPVIGNAIAKIPGSQQAIQRALDIALSPLPNTPPRIRDYLPNTASARRQFADTMWDAIARNMPMEALITNLLYEGSIFEGDEFLAVMREYLGKKVHGERNRAKKVYFKDLPIPLAVIAANIETGRMEVYCSERNGGMEVAEAVRRSMSIPFVFQPRGREGNIVDGGLSSNFPVWLFSAAGQAYWDPVYIDKPRPIVGFVLDETIDANPAWNVQPPRFQVQGDPPRVDAWETVVKPLLVDILREVNLPVPSSTQQLDVQLAQFETQLGDLKMIEEMVGVYGMNAEASTRKVITAGLMAGYSYYDVEIPLLGYHWLDFGINTDKAALFAMWDRAWYATLDSLKATQGSQALLTLSASAPKSPFKPAPIRA